jgi:hypothetical protein
VYSHKLKQTNMKRFPTLIMATMLGILTLGITQKADAQVAYYDPYDKQSNLSYQEFYDGLSPYGQWLYDSQYGYVWLPDVGPDFRPYYTNGYWAMTQYGNTWVSGYDWGWAAFHYGRWTFDQYYGWLWIPDSQWAPAWVSWRGNNDYYGWAPMGPGVGINISLGLIPNDWWVFLSPNYFYESRFQRYCHNDWSFNRIIYSQTNYINYTFNDQRNSYYTGPRADDYRRRTGRQTSVFTIDINNRRGSSRISGNRINMYRPSIQNSAGAAPRRMVQTERGLTPRPQAYNNAQLTGRDWVLRQTTTVNYRRDDGNQTRSSEPNTHYQNSGQNRQQPDSKNTPYPRGQNAATQQRNEQINRQNREQEQIRQQQQQRDAQLMQQGNEERSRQRAMQTEEANRQRMQQQRDAQINQQVEQENNRARQQQNQMEQQRRMQDGAPQPREQKPRESRPAMNDQRNNKESSPSNNMPRGGEGSGTRRR